MLLVMKKYPEHWLVDLYRCSCVPTKKSSIQHTALCAETWDLLAVPLLKLIFPDWVAHKHQKKFAQPWSRQWSQTLRARASPPTSSTTSRVTPKNLKRPSTL